MPGSLQCSLNKQFLFLAKPALTGAAQALMDWLQVPNVAAQMRHFCAHPAEALQLLYGKLLR